MSSTYCPSKNTNSTVLIRLQFFTARDKSVYVGSYSVVSPVCRFLYLRNITTPSSQMPLRISVTIPGMIFNNTIITSLSLIHSSVLIYSYFKKNFGDTSRRKHQSKDSTVSSVSLCYRGCLTIGGWGRAKRAPTPHYFFSFVFHS